MSRIRIRLVAAGMLAVAAAGVVAPATGAVDAGHQSGKAILAIL